MAKDLSKMFAMIALAMAITAPAISAELDIRPYEFKAKDGTIVQAERGEIEVPENRDIEGGKTIKIAFVRFKSTNPNPGYPLVYLAGGPGGSGISAATGRRFPLFMALRGVGDVIALDQRGTGASTRLPSCKTDARADLSEPLTRETVVRVMRQAAEYCSDHWHRASVDIGAYNTEQSAADLEDLRSALGAGKLTLWGISYGTHLAMAALKRDSEHIHKVVMASPEGLEQTVKLPARVDAYFARVEALVAKDPKAAQMFPNLRETMRRVLDRVEKEPVRVTFVPSEGAAPVTLYIGKFAVQLFTSFALVKNPENAGRLPGFYAMLDAGQFDVLARNLYRVMRLGEPLELRGLSQAMELASGIDAERLALVQEQAKTAILGDALNFPMPHLLGALEVPDLGDKFRAPFNTKVPALVLTGTLDGRTFPEAHAEVMANFADVKQIVIENAGHDLFMSSPKVAGAILAFLKGEEIADTHIVLPPPSFVP
jgi:pimeloyl-ACP methyl ester carboxylesterase